MLGFRRKQPPVVTYIPQANRTVIVRVEKPGEKPYELTADVYTEEELARVRPVGVANA